MSANTPPMPDGGERLLRLVQRASSAGRVLRRLLADHAAAIGLSDAELLIVWLCADGPGHGMVQGDLATAIGVSPALMSGTVERLRQRGLIQMQRSPVDRRRQVWRTTEAGRGVLAGLRPVLAALAQQLAEHFGPGDQQLLDALCERLTAAAQLATCAPVALARPAQHGEAA